jgi:hypothetical protein
MYRLLRVWLFKNVVFPCQISPKSGENSPNLEFAEICAAKCCWTTVLSRGDPTSLFSQTKPFFSCFCCHTPPKLPILRFETSIKPNVFLNKIVNKNDGSHATLCFQNDKVYTKKRLRWARLSREGWGHRTPLIMAARKRKRSKRGDAKNDRVCTNTGTPTISHRDVNSERLTASPVCTRQLWLKCLNAKTSVRTTPPAKQVFELHALQNVNAPKVCFDCNFRSVRYLVWDNVMRNYHTRAKGGTFWKLFNVVRQKRSSETCFSWKTDPRHNLLTVWDCLRTIFH